MAKKMQIKNEIKLKFYVLNYDFNTKKVIMYNIFDNSSILNSILKEIPKYLESPKDYTHSINPISITGKPKTLKGFEAFCEELRSTIAWKERGRFEYEISVGYACEKDVNNLEKWDCYKQAEPNIAAIAREILYQYQSQVPKKRKPRKKKETVEHISLGTGDCDFGGE